MANWQEAQTKYLGTWRAKKRIPRKNTVRHVVDVYMNGDLSVRVDNIISRYTQEAFNNWAEQTKAVKERPLS